MKAPKVIFLDVDGVLNCGQTRIKCCGFTGVDDDKCMLFTELVERTGAKVVLSSTWRKFPDMLPYLWEHLGEAVHAAVIGQTLVLESRAVGGSGLWVGVTRGDEIADWLKRHPLVRDFVILDDDGDMGALEPFLVRTDWQTGLTKERADEAARRLNGEVAK